MLGVPWSRDPGLAARGWGVPITPRGHIPYCLYRPGVRDNRYWGAAPITAAFLYRSFSCNPPIIWAINKSVLSIHVLPLAIPSLLLSRGKRGCFQALFEKRFLTGACGWHNSLRGNPPPKPLKCSILQPQPPPPASPAGLCRGSLSPPCPPTLPRQRPALEGACPGHLPRHLGGRRCRALCQHCLEGAAGWKFPI